MANDGRRFDAPGSPQLGQRVLDRKQRRLRKLGTNHLPRVSHSRLGRVDNVEQWTRQEGLQNFIATVHSVAEDGLTLEQAARHTGILRPLPAEDENRLHSPAGRASVKRPWAVAPEAKDFSDAAAAAALPAATPSRISWCDRPVEAVKHTSSKDGASGWLSTAA